MSSGAPAARRGPGRPAAATREQALAEARATFLRGERVELRDLSERLGLARRTLYRWFGSRDGLLGEVVAGLAHDTIDAARARTPGHGRAALLEVFDQVNRDIAGSAAMRAYLHREGIDALRLVTRGDGPVQPRTVARIERLIAEELADEPPGDRLDAHTLAFAIVRLAEAFLYNDSTSELRGDVDRLRAVQAALLRI